MSSGDGSEDIFYNATFGAENSTVSCIADNRNFRLAEIIAAAIFFPFHFFLFLAMTLNRKLVRRNITGIYAGNVIFVSVVTCLWRIAIGTVTYVNATKVNNHDAIHWWTFSKCLLLVFLLVISGSIGLFINSLRESAFHVHRTVAGIRTSTVEDCDRTPNCEKKGLRFSFMRWKEKNPGQYAHFTISLVWFVPILLTIISIFAQRCGTESKCQCNFDQLPSDGSINCEFKTGCSNIWQPMTNAGIIFGFCLWLFYVITLAILLTKAYHDLRHMKNSRSFKSLSQHQAVASSVNQGSNDKLKPNYPDKNIVDDREKLKDNENSDFSENYINAKLKEGDKLNQNNNANTSTDTEEIIVTKKPTRKGSLPVGGLLVSSLRRNLTLLFFMFFAYIFGTGPMAVASLLLSVRKDMQHYALRDGELIPIMILPIITEGLCSLMILLNVSTVKFAVNTFLARFRK